MTDCTVCEREISSQREIVGHSTCSTECYLQLVDSAQDCLKERLEREAKKIDGAYWRDE